MDALDALDALYLAARVFLWVWALWYLYVLVMGFYRAKLAHKLTPVAYLLALPALLIAFTLDLVINWTVATVWFRQWPLRPLELVTDRLSRYLGDGPGWRYQNASWVCSALLDYFDPHDKHCK